MFFGTFVGVKDIETVSQDISLTELGMNSMMAVEIKQTLEREFDVFLTAYDIRTLTFAKLAEIRGKNAEQEQIQIEEKIDISKQLFVRVTSNEDMIPDVCMVLPTRKDSRKVELFLLPGIEGSGHVFNSIAPRIKPIATALQYGTNNIGIAHQSIPEYADHLLPVRIEENINDINKMRFRYIFLVKNIYRCMEKCLCVFN